MKYSRIVVLACMLAGMAACQAYGDVLNGLFARYTFDTDASDSVGTNNGTLTNGASIVSDPQRGNVLSLDGTDDYVALPSAGLTAGRSNVTVTVWINPDEWVATNSIYDEYSGQYWQFSIYQSKWYTRDTGTGSSGSTSNDASLPTVPTGQWHHLALVYSSAAQSKKVYYDGVLYDTQIAPFPLTADRTGAAIGYPSNGTYYDGRIDDMRFYSRALSDSEISIVAEVPTHSLTVNSGSGDGSYAAGVVVDISADPAPSGMGFSQWTGNVAGVADVHAPSTTITMPASDAVITATYATAYTLTVNSGTGGGSYVAGAVVTITANGGPSGYVFDRWTGNTAPLANPAAMTTTVTMPASAVTVTAHYVAFAGYQLTVVSGTGSGYYKAGAAISLTANAAPSGQVFNMWAGDPDGFDSWAEMKTASATYVMPTRNMTLTATYRPTSSPVDWWPYFNAFCKTEFGAAVEPLTYTMFGDDLVFLTGTDSQWRYVSETSACVTFETNLPSKGWIEYGLTTAYGSTTPDPDRYYYLNMRHLTGLTNNTPYHYRLVAQDERGNVITSDDKTFTTATPANVIYVPAGVSGPPYNLSTAGRTYLLTQDLVCNRTAFEVQANDVTLDLGGHTVVYDQEDYQVEANYRDTSSMGVRAVSRTNVKVVNGTIVQGMGYNSSDDWAIGYSTVNADYCTGEVAGISAEYAGPQVCGMRFGGSTGLVVHHNDVLDRGGDVNDRHLSPTVIVSDGSAHHNLVKRARQGAIGANSNNNYYNNEMYVDSCATNAFGIGYYADVNSECYGNRIFGTGYLVVAIGTVSAGIADIMVHDNFVHLQATRPDDRWPEYGAQSGAYCCRITWGGDNIQYYDNVMVTYGRDGGMVRGTWFAAQSNITDCYFRNNILKAVLTTLDSDIQGCIVHVGDSSSSDAPIYYNDNILISNFCNVRLGEDYYGTGCNGEFHRNTYVKEGPDRADYRTIGVGYGSLRSSGHKFYDSVFEPGTGYDHVRWDGSGTRNFYVGWTLTVQTEPLANISVRDSTSAVVWTGVADASGLASKELYQYYARPTSNTFYTPHQVTASLGGNNRTVSVTLDAKKTVQVYLNTHALTVNSGSGGGAYYPGTVVAIAANAPASGSAFDAWVGNTGGVANVHAASTTLTMPDSAAVVTATYTLPQYLLTVNSGSGDGAYVAGTVVAIAADAAASGTVFDKWTGNTAGVANVLAASTTVTMPAANVAVTATYKLSGHSLTVNSGGGSGTYDPGAVVTIVADAPDTGLRFLAWTGDTAGVADVLAASTTITMPAADAAITATYTLLGDLNGDRFVGQGDLNIVLSQWGKSGSEIIDLRADANHDDFIGQGDLNIVLADWGESAP